MAKKWIMLMSQKNYDNINVIQHEVCQVHVEDNSQLPN